LHNVVLQVVSEETDSEHDFITSAYCFRNEIDRKITITRPEKWFGKMHCVPYQPKKWYSICRVCCI